MAIRIKRVYEPPEDSDGVRILVDRLWPRGLAKDRARVDRWLPDVAPSSQLRKWFRHDPGKWDEFRSRYFEELHKVPAVVAELQSLTQKGAVTLVFAAKNEAYNNAVALRQYLERSGT